MWFWSSNFQYQFCYWFLVCPWASHLLLGFSKVLFASLITGITVCFETICEAFCASALLPAQLRLLLQRNAMTVSTAPPAYKIDQWDPHSRTTGILTQKWLFSGLYLNNQTKFQERLWEGLPNRVAEKHRGATASLGCSFPVCPRSNCELWC